jgi:hypothetical protein
MGIADESRRSVTEDEMRKAAGSRSWQGLGALLGLALVMLLALSGCSTSGTGGNLQLGLAGSTADHPSAPPALTSNAPGGTFAFVYDNQIWLRDTSGLKQITHLVLSNGSTILWGPLVWSPSGRYIAYTLVEDLAPFAPIPTSGPIYVLDVSAGTTVVTPASGSVYGHTFTWLTDRALVYSNSGNLLLYDLGDEDPRVWTLRSALQANDYYGYTYASGSVNYGDVAVTADGSQLFYTTITVTSLGATGVVGSAEVRQVDLSQLSLFVNGTFATNDSRLPDWLANNTDLSSFRANAVGDLGAVYSAGGGDLIAGAWQMSADGTTLVTQRVNGVDLKGGHVSATYCVRTSNYGYSDCRQILGGGAYPIADRAALAVSGDGSHAALSVDTLYTQSTGGGGQGKAGVAGWSVPPSWSLDGKHVLATQLVTAATDASGVTRFQTNLIVYDGGAAGAVLIAGARNPSWKP